MKKKETSKKSITLDELGAMIAVGFKEQNETIHTRIDALESRLDARIDGIDARMGGIEQKLGTLHSDVLSMNYDHKKLKARIENVELRVFGSIQEA